MTWNQDYTPPAAQPNSKPLPRLAGETTADNPWPVACAREHVHGAHNRSTTGGVACRTRQTTATRRGSADEDLPRAARATAGDVNVFGQVAPATPPFE